MNIVVLGGGAIGSVAAAKLSAHHDVTLVGRSAHVEAIRARGLRITGIDPRTVRLEATTAVETLAPGAVVLLATKVGDSRTAVAPLLPLVDASHTIVCLQNGLYAEHIVREALDHRPTVLRAIVQYGGVLRAPGEIEFTVPGFLLLEQHERASAIASAFTAAGIEGRLTADIRREMWRKVIFNCVINPTTTIVGCPVGGITAPGLGPLNRLVMDECVAVARADGVAFDEDLMPSLIAIYGPSNTVVSMSQDIARGRPTEIDHLNGAVAALGQRLGVPCPINEALTTIVKVLEARSLEARRQSEGTFAFPAPSDR